MESVFTVFFALLGGLAVITLFFYGGAQVLRWLEVPDARQSPPNAAEQETQRRNSAAA